MKPQEITDLINTTTLIYTTENFWEDTPALDVQTDTWAVAAEWLPEIDDENGNPVPGINLHIDTPTGHHDISLTPHVLILPITGDQTLYYDSRTKEYTLIFLRYGSSKTITNGLDQIRDSTIRTLFTALTQAMEEAMNQ